MFNDVKQQAAHSGQFRLTKIDFFKTKLSKFLVIRSSANSIVIWEWNLSESQYDYSSWQQILREWRKNRWLWPQTWTCWLTSPLLRKVASRCTRCFKAVQPKSWFAEPREVVVREGCAWMVLGRWVDVEVFFLHFALVVIIVVDCFFGELSTENTKPWQR